MATKTVGRLKIQLDAVTNRFDKGMKGASKKVGRFQASITRARGVLRSFGAGLKRVGVVAAGAAVGLGVLINKSLASLDVLEKTSTKLGIASEKLAGLRHASELAGVGAAALDKALEKMLRQISDAADGTGSAMDALDRLGLSAHELKRLAPEEQFYAISDAMQSITNQNERIAATMDIFGRGGGDGGGGLLNILELGSDELRTIQAEAERMGIAFNNIDLAQIAAANDAFLEAKAVLKGIADRFTVDIAPMITVAAERFKEWSINGVDAVGAVINAFKKLEPILDGLLTSMDILILGLKTIKATAKGIVGITAIGIGTQISSASGIEGGPGDAIKKIGESILGSAGKDLDDAIKDAEKILPKITGSLGFGVDKKKEDDSFTGRIKRSISSFMEDVEKKRFEVAQKAQEKLAEIARRQAESKLKREEKKEKQIGRVEKSLPDKLATLIQSAKGKAEQRAGLQVAAVKSPLELLRLQREGAKEEQEVHDRNAERTANILQHMMENGITLDTERGVMA